METQTITMEELSILQGVDYSIMLEREYNEDLYDDTEEDTLVQYWYIQRTHNIHQNAVTINDQTRRSQNA